jgi:hypothetical protein
LFIAIFIGLLVGALSSLPFLLNGKITKRMVLAGHNMTLGILIMEVVASFIVMSLALVLVAVISIETILYFAIAMLAIFLCFVFIGAFMQMKGIPDGKSR